MSARYNFTCTRLADNENLKYEESAPEEDALCERDDVSFAGAGYLKFWKRCKQWLMDNRLDGSTVRAIILDTFTGEEKQLA